MQNGNKYIALTIFVVVGIVAFGVIGASSITARFVEIEETNDAVMTRLDNLETAVVSLSDETKEQLTSERQEQAQQQREIEESLAGISETIDVQSQQLSKITAQDLTAIVSRWEPFVYRLACRVVLEDGAEDQSKGSATVEENAGGLRFVTNRHVIEEEDRLPVSCALSKPDDGTNIVVRGENIVVSSEQDIGYGRITSPVAIAGMSEGQRCTAVPKIGDAVVILGYPKIGGDESITATEGIISGFDDDFYTTSAKIERGNSGGIAVHVKDGCVLGIPTLVVRGGIESLARILPIVPE